MLLFDRPVGICRRFRLEQSVLTREGSVKEFEHRQSDGHSARQRVSRENASVFSLPNGVLEFVSQ